MPSDQDNEYRLIIDDAKTGRIINDVVVSGKNIADPETWDTLPGKLKETGRIIKVNRDQLREGVFNISVDTEEKQ